METLISVITNFFALPKADFWILSSIVDIIACKKFAVIDELMPKTVSEFDNNAAWV